MEECTFGVDGDMIACWRTDDFIDPVSSPMGYGRTNEEAYEDLLENELK